MDKINCLDKGYVILQDKMGSDLTVANAARASFMKKADELTEKDIRLIKFLAREDHSSPFRNCMLSFEIKAPLFVARQWFKYKVGSHHTEDTGSHDEIIFTNNGDDSGFDDTFSSRNEASRRYLTLEIEHYIPNEDKWRGAPDNMKQGSKGFVDTSLGKEAVQRLLEQVDTGMKDYDWAIENGFAPEQARLFIPSSYGMMTSWYWTASLQSVAHFLNQRLAHDAQHEIQLYAKAVYDLTKEQFPVALSNLVKN